MIWLAVLGVVLIICFGGVVLFGAPYVPTLTPQVRAALELAAARRGDTLLELGCGDGKVLIAAAEQGLNVIGYELNPLLAVLAWLRTRRYRGRVRVIWGNFWWFSWPPAEVIFVFLLPRYMAKLDKKIVQYKHKPVKLVSFAFEVPGRRASRQKGGVFLYDYR